MSPLMSTLWRPLAWAGMGIPEERRIMLAAAMAAWVAKLGLGDASTARTAAIGRARALQARVVPLPVALELLLKDSMFA